MNTSCESFRNEVIRFVDLIFSYNFHTPYIDESCMYIARNLSLRSADLNRQVGAVIADDSGNILATGFNDVPKPGGGLYKSESIPDNRDYVKGHDPNIVIKKSKGQDFDKELKNVLSKFKNNVIRKDKKLNKLIKNISCIYYDSLNDHIADSRSVHAEEAAICDAAVRGVSITNSIMYVTTFPCHLCAKHILAVGIKKVIYIEPYPKSKVDVLFRDEIALSKKEDGKDKLNFVHFQGVKPRTFRHVFNITDPEGQRRKDNDGRSIDWGSGGDPELIYSLRILHSCYYFDKEEQSFIILNKFLSGGGSKVYSTWFVDREKSEDTLNRVQMVQKNVIGFLRKMKK